MNFVIECLKYICGCCSLFVSEKESQLYIINDYFIHNSITSELLTPSYINYYAISDNNLYLYLIYSRLLSLENQPKFRILNGFLRVDYQSYHPTLANLSMAEEVAIGCTHPIVSIFILMPFRAFNPVAYSCIKGYTILFLQTPAFLLTLLLSPTLVLHNVICIVWAGRGCSTDLDL